VRPANAVVAGYIDFLFCHRVPPADYAKPPCQNPTQPNKTKPNRTEPCLLDPRTAIHYLVVDVGFFRVESEQVDSPLTPSPLSENSVEVCGHILAKTFLHQLKLNDVGVYRV